MDELKPCPFCGCDSAELTAKYGRNGWFIFARCNVCGAESKKFGIGRNTQVPDEDSEFWSCDDVETVSRKASTRWNMRRCADAGQDY